MSNLLPEEYKKILRQAYLLRVTTVALACLLACLLFAVVTQLPAYFAISIKAKTDAREGTIFEDSTSDTKEAELLVAQAQDLGVRMETLEAWLGGASVYEDTLRIVKERPAGIAITSLVYQRKTLSVVISGIARQRDNLLSFVAALEKSEKFATIDLPVSSLAEKEKVNFSLTVSLKRP